MRKMPRRETKRKETKEERKAERKKVGRLSEQRVSLATAERYTVALRDIGLFVGSQVAEVLRRNDLESVLCQYIEVLWEEGDPKSMANYALAAVHYRKPELKGALKGVWQLGATNTGYPAKPRVSFWPLLESYGHGNGLGWLN